MDTSVLISALQATNSPNNDQRNAAEKYLASNVATAGFFPSLLSIVADPTSQKSLKQAAAIALKNRFRNVYSNENNDGIVIPDADKAVIKENIIRVICDQTDNSVVQLVGCVIREITKNDFPNNWPQFQPQIETYLNSNSAVAIYNALYIIKEVFAQLEYKEAQREVVKSVFAYFYQYFINFLGAAVNQEDGYKMCHIILKIYNKYLFGLFRYDHDNQINFDQVTQWIQILCTILVHPAAPLPKDITIDEFKELPWWNTKTKAMKILNRFQREFGRKPSAEDQQDAQTPSNLHRHTTIKFLHTISPLLLNTVIQDLTNYNQGKPCCDHLLCEYFTFLTEIVDVSSLYRELKKHLSFLFMELSPKLLQLTQEDLELYQDEPQDFITKYYSNTDYFGEYTTIRMEVSDFISHISKVRAGNILTDYVNFLVQMLDQYNNTPMEQRNYAQKEWVLYVLGLLSNNLISKSVFKGNLEILLNKHVYPEFNSSYGVLRARACLTYKDYSRVKLNDQHFHHVIEKILNCLQDSELPVQVAAASTLEIYISADACKELIRPHIQPILKIFIDIMHKLGVQEVIDTLDEIAANFENEIVPICGQLVDELMKSVQGLLCQQQDELNDDTLLSIDNRLQVVSTLVGYLETHKELYNSLLSILYPYLQMLLNPQYIDVFDNVLSILTCFLLYTDNYCDELYQLYPSLVNYLSLGAIDYCTDAFSLFSLFIGNDPAKFASFSINNVSYIDLTLQFIKNGLNELGPSEQTYLYMIELLIIQNCLNDNPMILERVLKSALQDLDIVMKNLASLQESVNNNTADEYTEYDIEDNNLLISRLLINIESCIVLRTYESLEIIRQILPVSSFIDILLKYHDFHTSTVELKCLSDCLSTLMTINMDEYQIDIHSYLGKLLMVDINSILNLQKVSSEDEEAEPEEIDFDELERKLCDEHYADDDWGYDENNDVDESKEDLLNQLTDKELNYLTNIGDSSIKELDRDLTTPFTAIDPINHLRSCVNRVKSTNEPALMNAISQLSDIARECLNGFMVENH